MKSILLLFFLVLVTGDGTAQPVDSTRYAERPITLHTSTGDLFGTLCVPTNGEQFPVALIVAGSGPTDRDGNNIMGVNCDAYKILARRLATNNIASVRFDKRGIGESAAAMKSESDLRFDNYIDDAREWINSLKRSKRFSQVIVIGHSEGSLIGMVAARHADKYVSIAGVGTEADALLKRQLASMPSPRRDTAYAIIDSLAAGHCVSHVPTKLRMIFRPSVQPYVISWMYYNPQSEIQKLHIPILILQGTNDIQVDTSDAHLLASASPNAKLVLIPNMNHLFRIVTSADRADNLKTYSDPDLPISDELVNEIVEFAK